eukprot:PLAT15481.1.p1 GENE.PLAT15481.1~~PLAT15481.1.p1  ORF type:complete len:1352 (-),score=644.53 PLAT15481.1:882-4937(-)
MSGSDDTAEDVDPTGGGLFLFVSLFLGVLLKELTRKVPLPYTVLVMLAGVLLGALSPFAYLSSNTQASQNAWASIDPHILLFIFLPALLFESAFSTDWHVFRRSLLQIVMLAGPGVLIGTTLTALLVSFFPYGWDWARCAMFGSILSATDPVAVVALLHELGAPERLGVLIEGESLLNDGVALVLFLIFHDIVNGTNPRSGGQITVLLLQMAAGGPVLGIFVGFILALCLERIVDEPVHEVTFTVLVSYLTFYVAEATQLHVSGVLAVVAMGLYMSARGRTAISPVSEQTMEHFWAIVGYIANTLVFMVAGLVVARQMLSNEIEAIDWLLLGVLYICLNVIRALVTFMLRPVMNCMGDEVTLKDAAVMSWGGLRGAVGLALALIVQEDSHLEHEHKLRARVVFHVAGIAFLTLLVNGSSTKSLLSRFKLTVASSSSIWVFQHAVDHVKHALAAEMAEMSTYAAFNSADFIRVGDAMPRLFRPPHAGEERTRLLLLQMRAVAHAYVLFNRPRWQRAAREAAAARSAAAGRGGGSSDEDDAPATVSAISVSAVGSGRAIRGVRLSTAELEKVRGVLAIKAPDLESPLFESEVRRRYLHLVKSLYWEQFELGYLSAAAVRGLLESVKVALDHDLDCGCQLNEWKYLLPQLRVGHSAQSVKDWPLVGYFASAYVARRLRVSYDILKTFIWAHEHVAKRFDDLVGSGPAARHVLAESRSNVRRARSYLRSMNESFPAVSRAVYTALATRVLLNKLGRMVDNLLHHGQIDDKEHHRLQEHVRDAWRRFASHPVKLSLPTKLELLSDIPLFHNLTHEQHQELARMGEEVEFNAGERLLAGTRPTEYVYVILHGSVRLSQSPELAATHPDFERHVSQLSRHTDGGSIRDSFDSDHTPGKLTLYAQPAARSSTSRAVTRAAIAFHSRVATARDSKRKLSMSGDGVSGKLPAGAKRAKPDLLRARSRVEDGVGDISSDDDDSGDDSDGRAAISPDAEGSARHSQLLSETDVEIVSRGQVLGLDITLAGIWVPLRAVSEGLTVTLRFPRRELAEFLDRYRESRDSKEREFERRLWQQLGQFVTRHYISGGYNISQQLYSSTLQRPPDGLPVRIVQPAILVHGILVSRDEVEGEMRQCPFSVVEPCDHAVFMHNAVILVLPRRVHCFQHDRSARLRRVAHLFVQPAKIRAEHKRGALESVDSKRRLSLDEQKEGELTVLRRVASERHVFASGGPSPSLPSARLIAKLARSGSDGSIRRKPSEERRDRLAAAKEDDVDDDDSTSMFKVGNSVVIADEDYEGTITAIDHASRTCTVQLPMIGTREGVPLASLVLEADEAERAAPTDGDEDVLRAALSATAARVDE